MGDLWQRDERALRWVITEYRRAGRYDFEYETNPPQPIPELDRMLSTDLQTSLWRLHQFGLIHADAPADPNCRACVVADLPRNATVGTMSWSRLGPTASGLIALGEFPDLDHITSPQGIRAVLDALANWAPEEAASRLRKAAGLFEQMDDDVLRATLASVAASPPSMSPLSATQSSDDGETAWERRDLQVLQLFARPGTIDAHGAYTLSQSRLRELGLNLTFDEMLRSIHALGDLGYVDGHGWVEGVPEGGPTEVRFECVEYRHFFVTGRGLRALGEWPSFTDLTPTTIAALLERLAAETADQAQADETRAAAWDIRVLGPGILDVAVNVAAPV